MRSDDPNLIVGVEGGEDAGVYRIADGVALVETTDIITPLVDDPFTFGRIAAANALSDVYAMGGRPVTAMNLAFFPSCSLPVAVLSRILAGGADALAEANTCLVGGHTVDDDELKYGLSVTGLVDPARVVRNCTAKAGDVLILTKPLGTGIVATAIKADLVPATVAQEAIGWMCTLNRAAAEVMTKCGVSSATDVTGFGFIGHACEMALGSHTTFLMELRRIPLMTDVPALAADGMVPAGCYRNRDHYGGLVAGITGEKLLPLFDPQTSGGLLMSFPPEGAQAFLKAAAQLDIFAVPIGEVAPRGDSPLVFY